MTSDTNCKNTAKIQHFRVKIKKIEKENCGKRTEIQNLKKKIKKIEREECPKKPEIQKLKNQIKEIEREECVKTARERNFIKPPINKNLPFFAYGFYKPHQLAYPTIQEFIDGTPKKSKIRAKLKQINGIPVLIEADYNNYVEGYLINFKEGMKLDAYKKVGYSRNDGIYKWEEMKVGNQKVNVLVSSKPELFVGDGVWYNNYDFNKTKYIEDLDCDLECYDWRKDPIFNKPLNYIKTLLSLEKPAKNQDERYVKFMDLQMFYMLLWVSIDRFLSFRYGETKKNNVIFLSEEESFKKALKKHVKEERGFYDKKVYSARDLRAFELNPDKPTCSAMFYYTIRNNVVHNGKTLENEQEMLLNSLKQLLNIFSDVVEAAKRE